MKLLLKLHWIFLSNHIWIEFWEPYLPTTVTYLFPQIGIQKLQEHHRFPAKIQELPGQISKERQLLSLYVIPQTVAFTTAARFYCMNVCSITFLPKHLTVHTLCPWQMQMLESSERSIVPVLSESVFIVSTENLWGLPTSLLIIWVN